MMMMGGGGDVGDDDGDKMISGVYCDCARGVWRWLWRRGASGVVDRVDPVVRTTFGLRRKNPPKHFSGCGSRNPVGEGGRR
ncbi:hypothetical protein Tco_0505259 [Tanacetum coccineum]